MDDITAKAIAFVIPVMKMKLAGCIESLEASAEDKATAKIFILEVLLAEALVHEAVENKTTQYASESLATLTERVGKELAKVNL